MSLRVCETVDIENAVLVTVDFPEQHRNARVILQGDDLIIGSLSEQDSAILSSISADPEMTFEWKLVKETSMTTSLAAILYAPLKTFHEIGDYLDSEGYFLQDPQGCSQNVKYRNPHQLSGLDENVPMTFELEEGPRRQPEFVQQLSRPVDFLNGFESRQVIAEATTPAALKTPLYSHQKRALSFMQERERGWNLTTGQDVWSLIDHESDLVMYKNNVSGSEQLDQPFEFRGGLLADEMGLGKTLTVLSLVASDREPCRNRNVSDYHKPSRFQVSDQLFRVL